MSQISRPTTPNSSDNPWLPVRPRIPLWLKVAHSGFLCILVPVYWVHYGPGNFLWGSDIALFLLLAALWLEAPLPNSMLAIGILPFEIAWCVDLLSGARLLGVTAYMFEPERAAYLRALSLFHLALPVMIVFLLRRLGYDRRALPAQSLLTWLVLPLTWAVTDPADNINLVFGPGKAPQSVIEPRVYLALLMVGLPLLVYWPMDWLLRRRPSWLRPDGQQ
jgi:hypothetical protein